MIRFVTTALLLALGLAPAVAETGPAAPPLKADMPAKAKTVAVEEPRDIVAALYKRAAIDLKKTKPTSPFFDRDARAKYFSKGFDLLITSAETKATHDGDAMIDFDPISAAQDTDMKTVTLKTDLMSLGKAVVSASFTNHGQSTVVTYDFLKEDGDWKIDDIKGTTEKEAWSVRKILKATGKEPTALPGMKDAGTGAVAKPTAE